MLVVNCHIASMLSDKYGRNTVFALLGLGGHGVDLFFVLSGWLLGHVLVEELQKDKTINVVRFLRRRWLRTLPAYYAVLVPTLLQAGLQQRLLAAELSYGVFLQGYVFDSLPVFGVSWSLCVEEHFYLVIAPLLLWIGKSNSRGLLILFGLIVCPMVARSMEWYENLQQSHVRIDQCAAGVVLAFIHRRIPRWWDTIQRNMATVMWVALAVLAWAVCSRFGLAAAPPLVAFSFVSCALVALSVRSWWARSASIPGAYYIATRSYSMYLVHVEAIALVKRLGLQWAIVEACVVWAVTLILAEALYRFIELPFMQMRERKPTETRHAKPIT